MKNETAINDVTKTVRAPRYLVASTDGLQERFDDLGDALLAHLAVSNLPWFVWCWVLDTRTGEVLALFDRDCYDWNHDVAR